MVFSSGKSVTAFVVALMVERGLVDYGEKVSTYWPEFGQNGKDDITVADVLRHEAGLAQAFDQPLQLEDIQTKNLKRNAVGKIIESSGPSFPKDNKNKDGTSSKRQYHAVTRGMILNEIVRRVDPKGRTVGEILREDIAIPGKSIKLPPPL